MFRPLFPLFVLGGSLMLSACQKPADVDPASTAAASAAESKPEKAPDATGTNGFLTINPGKLDACDPAVEATITHDLHDQHPDVKSVDLLVQGADGSEPKLFSRGGRTGLDKTGPWGRPGLHVILESTDTHEKLDEVQIAGPACTQ